MNIIFPISLFIFGLVVGSFLNVCISRLPIKESIVMPSSHCPKCKTKLSIFDLFPIVSFLLLRGKCRYCGEKISKRYPLVEILSGTVFLLLYMNYSFSLDLAVYLFFFSLLIVAAFADLETETIPDSVSILGPIPVLLISLFKGDPQNVIIGMALGFIIMWVFYKSGSLIYKKEAMGGGDVKLAMMTGAYLGFPGILVAIFLAFIVGSLFGLALIILGKKKFGEHVPFGPFLVIGAVISVFWSAPIIEWYLGLIW